MDLVLTSQPTVVINSDKLRWTVINLIIWCCLYFWLLSRWFTLLLIWKRKYPHFVFGNGEKEKSQSANCHFANIKGRLIVNDLFVVAQLGTHVAGQCFLQCCSVDKTFLMIKPQSFSNYHHATSGLVNHTKDSGDVL